MATISLLCPLILLILSLNITTSSAAPLLLNAAEILSDSGHLSMSLTLQLIHEPPLLSQSPSTTIFAPSNAAFLKSGQPSLNQLHYQISPIYFSLKTLKSLPINTKLSTLFSNHSLTITSSPFDSRLSINNIPINDSTLFDDKKSLIIFSVDSFFDYSPQIPPIFEADSVEITKPPVQAPDPGHRDTLILRHPFDVYARASNLLRLSGYNRMATFLDMQLVGVVGELKLTVFAPADLEIDEFVRGNFSDYSWVFKQHVVPHWLSFAELTRVYDGTLLQTFSERFKIEVTRSGEDGVIEINGVPIVFPDMFYSDWLVVHGLQSSLLDT